MLDNFGVLFFSRGLYSDLQGHRERPDDLPATSKVGRIAPLDLRTSALRGSRPAHGGRLRHVRLARGPPRRLTRHQPCRP